MNEKKSLMDKFFARLGVAAIAVLFMATSFVSCRKEGNTLARVTVVDTSGTPFAGAMVRLYPTPTVTSHGAIIIDDTLYSGVDGMCTFDYTDKYNLGQAGFAVLDIECRAGDTLYGEGIIKIEDEQTSEATVVLQP